MKLWSSKCFFINHFAVYAHLYCEYEARADMIRINVLSHLVYLAINWLRIVSHAFIAQSGMSQLYNATAIVI